jgi:hypothetical protein
MVLRARLAVLTVGIGDVHDAKPIAGANPRAGGIGSLELEAIALDR